ncbi:MAG: transposase [Candidatus Dadabacteria bacterium]|nr:transposase [Candidatus Dadabacteria bacterium]
MKRGRSKYDDSECPIFITTTITNHINVFQINELAIACLRLLEERRKKYYIRIYCYCLMPNHIHMIAQSIKRGDISNFIREWKSFSARQIITFAKERSSVLLRAFSDSAKKYGLKEEQDHQIWMPRFDDLQLRSPEVARIKVNYIHMNPVRKNMIKSPEQYSYSSAGWYDGGAERFLTLTDIKAIIY